MADAAEIHEELQQAIEDLAGLRLRVRQVASDRRESRVSTGAVAHVRIGKGVASKNIVLTDLEKRNIIDGETEEIRQFLMTQGTVRFKEFVIELRGTLSALLGKWTHKRNGVTTDEDATETDGSFHPENDSDTESEDWQEQEHDDGALLLDYNEEDEPAAVSTLSEKTPLFDDAGASLLDFDSFAVFTDSQASSLHMSALLDSQSSSLHLSSFQDSQPLLVGSQTSMIGSQTSSIGSLPSLIATGDDGVETQENEGALMTHPAEAADNTPTKELPTGPSHQQPRQPTKPQRDRKRRSIDEHDSAPASKAHRVILDDPAPRGGGIIAQVRLRPGSGSSTTRRAKHGLTGARLEVVQQESKCPVVLGDFVYCLQHHTSLPNAVRLQDKYPVLFTEMKTDKKSAFVTTVSARHEEREFNFVVPKGVFNIVKSAIDLHREADGVTGDEAILLSPRQYSTQHVAKIASNIREFSERTICQLSDFFDAKERLTVYVGDAYWVSTPSLWSIPAKPAPVPFLHDEANQVEGLVNSLGTTNMRKAVAAILDSVSLKTVLTTDEEDYRVSIEQVIGAVAQKARLNDAVMYFALKLLARGTNDVEVIDPSQLGKVHCIPSSDLKSRRVVIFPINYDQAHWCVACVTMELGEHHRVFLYDPLVTASYQERLMQTWQRWRKPLLDVWFERDHSKSLGPIEMTFVDTPKQKDSVSCGVYCIVQAGAYISDGFEAQDSPSFSPFQLQVIRLRILWLILCKSRIKHDHAAVAAAAKTVAAMNLWIQDASQLHDDGS
ncbi:hypothetical protein PINS_up017872 [Pythium insidiosum]|nr:hypothetical protein PINS_up017872 [Pythium insidiosum]